MPRGRVVGNDNNNEMTGNIRIETLFRTIRMGLKMKKFLYNAFATKGLESEERRSY